MGDGCANCDSNGRCSEHSAVEQQMDSLKELPNTVSNLTGIVSVIAGLFALLVGLAFNSHFEQIHQADNVIQRFDALGTQISTMSDNNNNSRHKFSERLVRIETRIDTLTKDAK